MTENNDWTNLVAPPSVVPHPASGGGLDGMLHDLTNGAYHPDAPPPPPPPPAPDGGGGGGGAGTAANTDGQAANGVDTSAANSQGGHTNSQSNLDQLRAEVQRLGPILDTPEGQQQLMDALQRYLAAGGGQLQATDGAAQQQAGDLQGLADQITAKEKGKKGGKSDDSDDDSDDDHHHDKGDDAASSFKDLLSSLPQALQGLNPFGQGSPFGQSSPFGESSPFGAQSSPFGGAGSPFGPASTAGGVTPAANPFSSLPGTGSGAGGGSELGGAAAGAGAGSPFDPLKPAGDKPGEGGGDGDDSTTVTTPDGQQIQAATPELAKAMRASFASGDAAAGYAQAGIDVGQGQIVDPEDVKPGNWAKYSDGHIAVAEGPGKVYNNGQVVDVGSDPNGSEGFEGWYAPGASGGGGSEGQGSTPTVTASKQQ